MDESRRLSPRQPGYPRPTRAFHGAGELSPALSTRTRRFARRSRQSGASSLHPWSTPGLPTDCELRRTGHSADRFSPDRPPRAEDPDQEDHQKKPPPRRRRRTRAAQDRPTLNAATEPKKHDPLSTNPRRGPTWRPARPYIPPASCSALLRAPAGSFEKGGVPHSQPSRPPPPRAACGGRGNRYMAQA